jgi:hypothetical protein
MEVKSTQTAAAEDVSALLRARNALLWIVTREEARVERYLVEAAAAAGYEPLFWDVVQGTTRPDNSRANYGSADPGEMLTYVQDRARQSSGTRTVWIMRDLHAWLSPPVGTVQLRQLRNLARLLPSTGRNNAQAIIVLTPVSEVPAELMGHTTVVEWPLPDRQEVTGILDAAIAALPEALRETALPADAKDAAIDAAIGLSGEEAASCYARSLVQSKKIDPVVVSKEKKRVIARERVLEWFDPLPGGLNAVGGLANLKVWLEQRKLAYSAKARAYGLPAPRGVLLLGLPGTGKSLIAKSIATAWDVPLLRVDLGGMKSKFVGDSEANLRKAFKVVESIGRCVVWFDEIEKALAGATQGAADGGVSADTLGFLLSWMQERQGEAFVIATANDPTKLPPEFMRKGRFDNSFWLDLPNLAERQEILATTLAGYQRAGVGIDLAKVAAVCNGFTGSEIAALVPDALFTAFGDNGREITTDDLVRVAETVVPLSKTADEKILAMRQWAKGRAVPASALDPTSEPVHSSARALDI